MTLPTPQIATNPWKAWPAVIERVAAETPGVATYDLRILDREASDAFRYRPGQFNMLYLPSAGEIAISISGDAREASMLRHTVREVGTVTRALAQLGERGSLGIRGPFGTSWPVAQCISKDVILVAGGIGLAPLRPVVYALLAERDRFDTITLLYGARTPDDLLFAREFDEWSSHGLTVQPTVDRAPGSWRGQVGVVTLLLQRLPLPRPEKTILMTCGPEVMMWYIAQTAIARGIRSENLWLSLERNMNCAIGLCGHCQFGPEFICKDGPVFRFDRVERFLQVTNL